MGLAFQNCVLAKCDECGQSLEAEFVLHFDHPVEALDIAHNSEWLTDGLKLYCCVAWADERFPKDEEGNLDWDKQEELWDQLYKQWKFWKETGNI